jgi:hypothetical protein
MEQAYGVIVDGVIIKDGLSKQDATDLARSFAGIVKETTQVEAKPTTQRATQ